LGTVLGVEKHMFTIINFITPLDMTKMKVKLFIYCLLLALKLLL